MKRLAILSLAIFAAACTSQPPTYRDLETIANQQQREAISRPAPDSCQMAAHQNLIGRSEAEIDRASLPEGARVMINDPAQFAYYTGRGGVGLPNSDPAALPEIAARYAVDYLLLEADGAGYALPARLANSSAATTGPSSRTRDRATRTPSASSDP